MNEEINEDPLHTSLGVIERRVLRDDLLIVPFLPAEGEPSVSVGVVLIVEGCEIAATDGVNAGPTPYLSHSLTISR